MFFEKLCEIRSYRGIKNMAERAGFEPAIPFSILAFQASALGHYATSPCKDSV